MLTDSAATWLKSRKISPGTVASLGVRSEKRGGGDWLAYPYLRGAETITRKYRRIDQKGFSQDADPPEQLCYNEDALTEPEFDGPVILTEGELDCWSGIEAGLQRIASVPDGAPNRPVDEDAAQSSKWSYLDKLVEILANEREIILAFDADQNGSNLLDHVAHRLGKARCKFLEYPDGCKDLNDVLCREGRQGVTDLIKRARFIPVSGLVKLRDLPPAPEMVVYRTRLSEDFDKAIGFVKGHLSVWTGIPNHGKSALIRACCYELGRRESWRFAAGMFEDDIRQDFRTATASYISRRPSEQALLNDWQTTDRFLDERFIFILEDESSFEPMTIDWLLERMETAVVREGVEMVVIDPWSKLDHSRPHGMSENDYTAHALNLLKRFAKRFNVHVALVVHPKKMEADKNGDYRPPGGYDISGSSHWYNMPDLGVTVYRDRSEGDGCCRIIPWKIKRQPIMGRQRPCKLKFDPDSGRYSDWFAPDAEGI